jgi:hypothetical protein
MNYEVAVSEIKGSIESIHDKINSLVVDSEESLGLASDILKQVKDQEKLVDKREKEFTAPLNDTLKKIRDVFRPQKTALESLKRMIEQEKILPYHRELAEKRRLEEEVIRKALADKLRAEQEAKMAVASKFEDELLLEQAVKIDEKIEKIESKSIKTGPVKSEFSTLSVSKKWVFEIEDATQVPLRYLSPDEKKIKAAVDSGLRDIPGVKIYEKETVISR